MQWVRTTVRRSRGRSGRAAGKVRMCSAPPPANSPMPGSDMAARTRTGDKAVPHVSLAGPSPFPLRDRPHLVLELRDALLKLQALVLQLVHVRGELALLAHLGLTVADLSDRPARGLLGAPHRVVLLDLLPLPDRGGGAEGREGGRGRGPPEAT